MKNILSILLSLTLLLNPVLVLAENPQSDYDPKVKAAIYDLNHIQDAVKELDYIYNDVAPLGYSKDIVRDLHNRLSGSRKLISQILLDTKMSEEKKDEYLSELVPSYGAAWLKIFRAQNEDTVNDVRQQEYAGHPEVKELAKQIAKAKKGTEEWSDLQDEMINTLNGLEATHTPQSKEGNAIVRFMRGALRVGKNIGAEAVMDAKAVVTYTTTAKMQKVWTLLSRAYRDSASQDAARQIADLTTNTLSKMEKEDPVLDTQRSFWMKKLVHVTRLRSARLTSQRVMVAFYVGLAAWGVAAPQIDIVALADGGWSENSLFTSSMFYLTGWAIVASLKFSSYSGRTVAMLKSVKDLLSEAKAIDDSTLSDLRKKSLFDRLMRVYPKNLCDDVLVKNE